MVQGTLSHLVTQQMVSDWALIIMGNLKTFLSDFIKGFPDEVCLFKILFPSKKYVKEFQILEIIGLGPLSLIWNPWA